MSGDNAGDDVDEIGLRVDTVELGGFDERGDDGPVLGAAVATREQCILAIQSDRPDGALDDVGVDLDAAVVEEAAEPRPPRKGIADGLGELDARKNLAELTAS